MNGKQVSHLLFLFLVLAVFSGGCQAPVQSPAPTVASVAATPTEPPSTPAIEAISATNTPQPTETSAPADVAEEPTEPAAVPLAAAETGVGLDETSPVLDGVTVETAPMDEQMLHHGPRTLLQPAHTVLQLSGYPLAESLWEPRIVLYPAEAYAQLSLEAERQVAQLQALLAGWPDAETDGEGLPFLPLPNAAQILHAKAARLDFAGGAGIRYVTQYVQDTAPVTSHSLLYTFQGLTADGQFYVSAVLPVENDLLPYDIPQAQEEGFDSFTYNFDRAGYESYLAQQNATVDGLANDSFNPDLASLDALMQSLDLSAYSGPDVEVWAPEVAPEPDQVLDDFLPVYLAAGGFPAGAHVDSPDLHPDFVMQMEDAEAAYRAQGIEAQAYDPLLMSQLGPPEVGDAGYGFERFGIGPPVIDGDAATVTVQRHWHYTGAASPLQFTLAWNGERWQITGVSSIVEWRPSAPSEPALVAEQYMTAMVAAAGEFATPQEWLARVDAALVAPNAKAALCDGEQSWPVGYTIEGSFAQRQPLHLSTNVEQEAYVVVYRIEKGVLLTLHLVQVDGDWQVSETICGDTPQGRALAFYSWYLGAAAQAGETRWAERTPNIDAVNDGHFFVTADFLRDARMRFQEDPYLPPARVPDRITVRSGAQENLALVDLEYLGETEAEIVTVQLTFVQDGGVWLIDGLEVVETEF